MSNTLLMKTVYLTLICCIAILFANAQQVKPYLTTVKTKSNIVKGILYKVDTSGLLVATSDSLFKIPGECVTSIKIRTPKKKAEVIRFLTYDPWNESNFEKRTDGLKVRKWGEKDPTLGEEISGHVATTLINIAGNVIAAPIQAINPSIANFKIKSDLKAFRRFQNDLNFFSVYYQSDPNQVAELRKIKEISRLFKP